MNHTRTRDMTRTLGPPKGWNEEADGVCDTIEVRMEPHGRFLRCISTWKPTLSEIAHIVKGGVIELSVLGVMPPVRLDVVDPATDEPTRQTHITINEAAHGL